MNQGDIHLRKAVVERLVNADITPTRQRIEIGLCLFDGDKHVTADQLLEQVNRGRYEVSKATVYNTLGLFAAKGLLREVVVDSGRQIYDTNVAPHHHLYNIDTGELQDIASEALSLSALPALDSGLEITGVDIVIRVRNAS